MELLIVINMTLNIMIQEVSQRISTIRTLNTLCVVYAFALKAKIILYTQSWRRQSEFSYYGKNA